jgi:hypothetical protein
MSDAATRYIQFSSDSRDRGTDRRWGGPSSSVGASQPLSCDYDAGVAIHAHDAVDGVGVCSARLEVVAELFEVPSCCVAFALDPVAQVGVVDLGRAALKDRIDRRLRQCRDQLASLPNLLVTKAAVALRRLCDPVSCQRGVVDQRASGVAAIAGAASTAARCARATMCTWQQ